MKFVYIALLIFTLFTKVAYASPLDPGILSLPITTISGETTKLADYIGIKPVYLKFWATWCQPCRKQMPHFQHVQNQYGEKIIVIAINIGINDSLESINDIKKEFNLTMPIAIDTSGQLARAFNLIGTPYHILIDINGNLIHKGYEASTKLDNTLKLLATNNTEYIPNITLQPKNNKRIELNNINNKITALFFTATWCDWYLKDSRSTMSKNCINAQNLVNTFSQKFSQFQWHGIISRLWTGKKELNAYINKYKIKYPTSVDTSNSVFLDHKVKKFPTLILIRNGKEIYRTDDFNNNKSLSKTLTKYISNDNK